MSDQTENLQWKVGDVTITRVVESVAHIPAGGLLPTADDAASFREHFA